VESGALNAADMKKKIALAGKNMITFLTNLATFFGLFAHFGPI